MEEAAINLDYDFVLPEEAIALRPASPRDAARLLVVRPDASPLLAEAVVADLQSFLRPGDCLVLNDTKVIPAALSAIRERQGTDAASVPVSLTMIEPMPGRRWKALAKPGRRLRRGDRLVIGEGAATLTVAEKFRDGSLSVESEASQTVEAVMMRFGSMPIPPYISRMRGADEKDRSDYQTTYAAREGAVAAPTAGLHFTPELLERLRKFGVAQAFVTLHVGAGTFLPVKSEDLTSGRLHFERAEVSPEAAAMVNKARSDGGRIIAVGTTSLRTIETAATEDGTLLPFNGETDLFIRPGYKFKIADMLLTNFHLPKSTLFMLVCAFSGTGVMREAYAHAISSGFRFYSYGDACLLNRSRAGEAA